MKLKIKFALVMVSLLAIVTAGCAKKEAAKPKDTIKAEAVEPAAQNEVSHKVLSFSLEGLTDKGEKKWDVKGESAESISQNEVKLDNIVARAFGDEAEASITADQGIYDKSKNNVTLEKNVKATIESGRGLSGTLPNFTVQAKDASESKEERGAGSKKQKTVITCDGEAQFDYVNNLAYFSKNVKVVSDDGSIDADKITINLDPKTKKVYEIVAEGNVKIKRGEDLTYSEKATYIESEKKIVLTGQPKVVIYQEGGMKDNLLGKK